MFILLAPSEEKLPSAKPCDLALCEDFAKQILPDLSFFCPEQFRQLEAYFRALCVSPSEVTGAKTPAKFLAAHGADALPAAIRYTGVAFKALANSFDLSEFLDHSRARVPINMSPAAATSSQTSSQTAEIAAESSGRFFASNDHPTARRFGANAQPAALCEGEIFSRLIIFSNLFGAVLGSDRIPYYKLKQGQNLATLTASPAALTASPTAAAASSALSSAEFCSRFIAPQIDEYLRAANAHCIVDLRASHYEDFYRPSLPCARFKITKNGRALSHFAKHYRGLLAGEILREIAAAHSASNAAANCPQSATPQAFAELKHLRSMLEARFGAKCVANGDGIDVFIDFA